MASATIRAEHVVARRSQINSERPVVAERGDIVIPRRGGDGDQRRAVQTSGTVPSTDGADGACDVRPVPVVVTNVATVVEGVDSMEIVNVTVVVVINIVAWDFTGIRPDVRREIGMGVIDATVERGHDDAGITRGLVP